MDCLFYHLISTLDDSLQGTQGANDSSCQMWQS